MLGAMEGPDIRYRAVEVELAGLSGRCPSVTFTAAGRPVVAGKDTTCQHGRCADVSSGNVLTVDGTLSGKTVDATNIDLKGER